MRKSYVLFRITAAVFTFGVIPTVHAANLVSQQVVVGYGDLNLSDPAGQAELNGRLRDAAATLCNPVLANPDSDQSVLEHMSIYRACVGRLSERAMAKVKATRNLSQLH